MRIVMLASFAFLSSIGAAQVAVVDGVGVELGLYLDRSGYVGALPSSHWPAYYELITSSDYRFMLHWADGAVAGTGGEVRSFAQVGPYWAVAYVSTYPEMYFESDDCSGQPFAVTQHSGIVTATQRVPADPEPELWYVSIDEELELRALSSRRPLDDPGSCEENPFLINDGLLTTGRLLKNDPAETGVSRASYSLPLRLKTSSQRSECIFSDRFQCVQ